MTEFEKKIGYEFNNVALLDRALTHSSYAHEKATGKQYSSVTVKRLQAAEKDRLLYLTRLRRFLLLFTLTAELKVRKNLYCRLLLRHQKQSPNLRITRVCFKRFYSKIPMKNLSMSL